MGSFSCHGCHGSWAGTNHGSGVRATKLQRWDSGGVGVRGREDAGLSECGGVWRGCDTLRGNHGLGCWWGIAHMTLQLGPQMHNLSFSSVFEPELCRYGIK